MGIDLFQKLLHSERVKGTTLQQLLLFTHADLTLISTALMALYAFNTITGSICQCLPMHIECNHREYHPF
jgi:hypothetical protein